jgi:transcriptional regulator with XRE-family HTH domain|tara:strand:- start:124 stop:531 length:408 start_codon:yes stop_codon:yes gene_type:complete
MENSDMFTKRLQKLLDYYNLSASGLANKIGIQRSTISHVISGRNKPSLDFVMKILHNFNEVSIEWLIDGKGYFPKTENKNQLENISPTTTSKKDELFDKKSINITTEIKSKNNNHKEIDKIIILYKDGSFDSYNK